MSILDTIDQFTNKQFQTRTEFRRHIQKFVPFQHLDDTVNNLVNCLIQKCETEENFTWQSLDNCVIDILYDRMFELYNEGKLPCEAA